MEQQTQDKTTQTQSSIKVYMIYSPSTDLCYIGKTKRDLQKRFTEHKSSTNKCSSRELLDKYDDCEIKLLLQIEGNEIDGNIEESKQIQLYNSINKVLSYRSEASKKAKAKEYAKQYYIKNGNKIKQYEKSKYVANPEAKKQKTIEYYYNNKHIINQKVHCDICNIDIVKSYFIKHLETQSHKTNELHKNYEILLEKCYECK